MNSPITRVRLRRRTRYIPAAGAAALLLALFLLLGIMLPQPYIAAFDASVGEALRSLYSEPLHRIAAGFDALGSTVGFAAVTLLLMLILAMARRFGDAVLILAATGGAWGLNTIAKSVFARPRPEITALFEADGFSYPSGNATIGMALGAMAALIAVAGIRSTAARCAVFAAAALFILGIGISRVYGGVHYPSDIVGGYLLGAAYTVILTAVRRGRQA